MQRTVILGPPGCGKTTTLLEQLEKVLQQGVPLERIAFLTFTRRARAEALARIEKHFGKTPKDLPFFRTIHSMAFRALKLQEGDVLGKPELAEFGEHLGIQFHRSHNEDQVSEGLLGLDAGEYLMAVDSLSRLRGVPPKTIWESTPAAETPCDWPTVQHFITSYREYKESRGLFDFTDVLEQFIKADVFLPVDVAFIDEAQDLSTLQWFVALKACANAQHQYIAGDDDQAVFKWAGADVGYFQTLEARRTVLAQSYRLPKSVHFLAQVLVRRIKQRLPKEFHARDAMGSVHKHASLQGLQVQPGQQWLWLVRNRYLLNSLREHLEQQGIVYSNQHGNNSIVEGDRDAIYAWERLRTGRTVQVAEARHLYSKLKTKEQVKHGFKALPGLEGQEHTDIKELVTNQGLLVNPNLPWYEVLQSITLPRHGYYRKLLRNHSSLKLPVQVTLETIHGAKGAEANHVALFLDMSRRVHLEAQKTPDDEHRVWYVGATRARETLHLVSAHSPYSYPFPPMPNVLDV